ncbi:NmrA family NAD(P)-binding protein [Amycolatopsis sp. WQ 127309]|uniref:NmrA family NAD(P)-binding protein n=1 Tax=Amycolatopsis sp. WQ 127309 TaxID=2932773 RepID=UPI001FF5E47F|nr:NmrA family NAD(P)-binding protein [Amycolatopsis sp. WQ 127309]UOZ05628.1 NmrA family NAD(P)-binding protein [Amycolatopsis sp. WQ 127309]
MTVLITTAGKVGSEAARLLAERGERVRVLVRDPGKAAALADAGVEVVAGDLGVPETVDAAMRGVSSVVLVSPAVPEQELGVIRSAVRAGAGHVVKVTSKASADSPIARRRGQAEIEDGLIASGLSYTLLRNNAYMQNFFMSAPSIVKESSFGSAAGEGRLGMIDARDVAAVAAEIAVTPAGHAGKTYWPTGPESISFADAAVVLSKVLGRPIAFEPLTVEEQTRALVEVGLPAGLAAMNAQAVGLFAEGDCDYLTDDVPSILGRPARGFEKFVTDHIEVFS